MAAVQTGREPPPHCKCHRLYTLYTIQCIETLSLGSESKFDCSISMQMRVCELHCESQCESHYDALAECIEL